MYSLINSHAGLQFCPMDTFFCIDKKVSANSLSCEFPGRNLKEFISVCLSAKSMRLKYIDGPGHYEVSVP